MSGRAHFYDPMLGIGWESRVSKNLQTVVNWHCKKNKISVLQFCKETGLNYDTLRDNMGGRHVPSVATLAIVSLNTGVNVGYFC